MLKQSPNRNQRTKGFKVKLGLKIFVLIALGIWLLYQLKHSHDKKSHGGNSAKIFENLKAGLETKKLGRKGFQPRVNRPYKLVDDIEEKEPERVMEQSSGRDIDDIVGRDHERVEEEETEEVEDLIDEEDKEKEEQNEEEDGEYMVKQLDDMGLFEDQGNDEGENDTQAINEEHRKESRAS